MRQTVLFAPAIETLLVEGRPNLFLELGAHPVLGSSITRILRQQGRPGISLPSLRRGEDERAVMLRSLGTLYTAGFDVDWQAVSPTGHCVPLPAYPWQRERFWLEPAAKLPSRNGHSGPKNGKPLDPGVADWLYELDWISKDRAARPVAERLETRPGSSSRIPEAWDRPYERTWKRGASRASSSLARTSTSRGSGISFKQGHITASFTWEAWTRKPRPTPVSPPSTTRSGRASAACCP